MSRSYKRSPQQTPSIQGTRGTEPATEAGWGNAAMAQGLAEGPDAEFAAFLEEGPFSLNDHKPSTGLGLFDTTYDPKTGAMDVILRLGVQFALPHDASLWERTKAIFDGTDGWTDEEKAAWLTEFETSVEAAWKTDHQIRCTRPGWDLVAKPRVLINLVESGGDYTVTVHKSSGHGSDFRPDVGFPDRNAKLEEDHLKIGLDDPGVVNAERNRILAMTATPITFDMSGAEPSLPSAQRRRVAQMSAEIEAIPPGSPVFQVHVDAWGMTEAQTGELAAANEVAEMLPDRHRWTANNWGDNPVGQVTFSVNQHPDSVKYESKFQYAAHEIGHMLGLPDEYVGSGALPGEVAARDKMIEDSGADAIEQADTSSMMSEGGDVLTGHLVTMWEALGKMTAPALSAKEWQL